MVFKNFPLRSHKFADEAARAALAAHKQGKFWEYHEKIFENYRSLSEAKLQKFANDLQLDMNKFNQDMNSSEVLNIIKRDINEGIKAGVRGTPSIFINGKLLENRSIQGFEEKIRAELRSNRK